MISIPNLKQYEELKAKHPDAVLLFRVGDTYQSYAEDAKLVSKVLDLPRMKGEDSKNQKQADVTSFRYGQLDTYLPKLIRMEIEWLSVICWRLRDNPCKKNQNKK